MAVHHRGNRRRYVLLLLALTAVTLITLDRRSEDPGFIGEIGRVAHDVVSPVASAADAVVSPVADWFDGITSAGSLEKENERLRRQLAEAEDKVRRAEAAIQENRQLKALVGLELPEDVETVTARVVQASSGNYEWTITLDKGSANGVVEDLPVVGAAGLVGRVVDVWDRGSKVRLLTDPRSGVSVRMVRERVTGEAEGRAGRATLVLDLVDPSADIIVGDDAVTSGLEGSLYPPGIPVGEVASVEDDPGGLVKRLLLRPFADFARLELVNVLRPAPGAGGG